MLCVSSTSSSWSSPFPCYYMNQVYIQSEKEGGIWGGGKWCLNICTAHTEMDAGKVVQGLSITMPCCCTLCIYCRRIGMYMYLWLSWDRPAATSKEVCMWLFVSALWFRNGGRSFLNTFPSPGPTEFIEREGEHNQLLNPSIWGYSSALYNLNAFKSNYYLAVV